MPSIPLPVTFNSQLPKAQAAAARHAAQFVTVVEKETKQALRSLVQRSIRDGITPTETARLMRGILQADGTFKGGLAGLNRVQVQAVMNFREGLINSGMPLNRVDRMVHTLAEKKLRQRAAMIARTETIDSLNAGVGASWQEAARQGFLDTDEMGKKWIVTPDDALCPICAPLPDQGVIPIDESFFTAVGEKRQPTAHPRCRCAVGMGELPVLGGVDEISRGGRGLEPSRNSRDGKLLAQARREAKIGLRVDPNSKGGLLLSKWGKKPGRPPRVRPPTTPPKPPPPPRPPEAWRPRTDQDFITIGDMPGSTHRPGWNPPSQNSSAGKQLARVRQAWLSGDRFIASSDAGQLLQKYGLTAKRLAKPKLPPKPPPPPKVWEPLTDTGLVMFDDMPGFTPRPGWNPPSPNSAAGRRLREARARFNTSGQLTIVRGSPDGQLLQKYGLTAKRLTKAEERAARNKAFGAADFDPVTAGGTGRPMWEKQPHFDGRGPRGEKWKREVAADYARWSKEEMHRLSDKYPFLSKQKLKQLIISNGQTTTRGGKAFGTYTWLGSSQHTIAIGVRRNDWKHALTKFGDELRSKSWTTNGGLKGTFRHELGHSVWYQHMSPAERKEFFGLWEKYLPRDKFGVVVRPTRWDNSIGVTVSEYAQTNASEFWAEAFGTVVHPGFEDIGITVRNLMVPPDVQKFIKRILSQPGKEATPKSVHDWNGHTWLKDILGTNYSPQVFVPKGGGG